MHGIHGMLLKLLGMYFMRKFENAYMFTETDFPGDANIPSWRNTVQLLNVSSVAIPLLHSDRLKLFTLFFSDSSLAYSV